MSGATIHFEDFRPGEVRMLGPVSVSAGEIVDFARQWDPQPMHVDPDAARDTLLGELTASGWHTCCILMRMMCDEFILDAASMGGPGIEEVRWVAPVRPGDVLTARRTVRESRRLRSRPGVGLVRFRFEMMNQREETVMISDFPVFFRCRDSGAAA